MRNERPTHIDLFSGIGGFALAARWAGFRTVAFCEIDKYCQKVLATNFSNPFSLRCSQRDGTKEGQQLISGRASWGESDAFSSSPKLHSNIFNFDGTAYRGCDLLTGGFPCQPFSVAGKRRGAADDRALWPEMFRVIKEARPAWVLGENVPGLIPMELDNALSDLESIGYATRPFVIPACAVDARHRRDRLWIVGHCEQQGLQGCERPGNMELQGREKPLRSTRATGSQVADTERNGAERRQWSESDIGEACGTRAATINVRWQPEPDVGRVAHGIPSRVDRLKGLGNAIVPQVAYEILREIRKLI